MRTQIKLTKAEELEIAENMRLRHYMKYIGHAPSTTFVDLPPIRREKWLDEIRVAVEQINLIKQKVRKNI